MSKVGIDMSRKKAAAPGEKNDPPRRKRDVLLEWIIALMIALLVALVLTQVVFVNAVVPSESMEDTIAVGDRLIGLRFAYWRQTPARGDVIIFRYPDNEQDLYVKRVVGLPGEEVSIRDGQVYINGVPEPSVNEHVKGTPTGNYGPWVVPQGSYFVLGDNRSNSWDSRYWTNTFVAEDKILGKVVLRMFPNPGKLG